jgi:vacuolar-type H+-ATPase subunit H
MSERSAAISSLLEAEKKAAALVADAKAARVARLKEATIEAQAEVDAARGALARELEKRTATQNQAAQSMRDTTQKHSDATAREIVSIPDALRASCVDMIVKVVTTTE